VRSRLRRDPFAGSAGRSIEASVDHVNGAWHAEVNVRNAAGQVEGRRVFDVRAESCTPVVDAIGLAVALVIDPHADLASSTAPPIAANPSPDASIEPDLRQPATAEDAGRPLPPNRTSLRAATPGRDADCRPRYPPSSRPPRPLEINTRRSYAYEMMLSGLGASGLLPGVAPGVALEGAFGQQRLRVTLGLAYFPETALDSRFSFGLTTLNAGVCGDVVHSSRVSGGLCSDIEAGAMHAVVRWLQALNPGDRAFLAFGFGPWLKWHAWAPFFVKGGVSAKVALARPEFVLHGGTSAIFESRAVSGVAFIGVGLSTR
jgi:hypothetical protein